MRPGSHASGDGSFGRTAGIHAGKAIVLVAIAVLVGVLLLRHNTAAPVTVSAVGTTTTTTTTTTAPAGSTPTTAPAGSTATAPTTVALRTPANVKVLVANGTSVTGLAGRVSALLHSSGYDTLASTNATTKALATVVYYAPGFQPEALALAPRLHLSAAAVKPLPALAPVASLNGADVLVVAGPDVAASTPAATTTTTRPAATTTTKPG